MSERATDVFGNRAASRHGLEPGRLHWTRPSVRRLMTSAAEAGATVNFDLVEVPS